MEATGASPNATCNHVGIVVADLDASEEFYREVGCVPTGDETIDFRGRWLDALVGHEEARVAVRYLGLGDLVIELIQYLNPPGEALPRRRTNAIGGAHIAVEVAAIEELYERMRVAGRRFVSPPARITEGDLAGTVVVYSFDPDGNVCELVDPVR